MAKIGFDVGAVAPSDGHSDFGIEGRIDYRAVAADLLARADTLLQQWLPLGKWDAGRKEYTVGDLHGSKGHSLSINSRTGVWKDFADEGVGGGDLLSLYARIHGIPMHEAVDDLTNGNPPRKPAAGWGAPDDWSAPEPAPKPALTRDWKVPSPWQSQNVCHHFEHGKASNKWAYLNGEGKLIGYIARYDPPTGKKQFCPWTWDGTRWGMKKWQGIQPIYGAELLTARPADPVLVVEGEKACDAARKIVGEEYVVVTWPGGANAWQDADWAQLAGRAVLIWPDADKAGRAAAAGIRTLLDPIAAQLATLDVASQADGWDAADALADGWERPRFDQWVKDQFGGAVAGIVNNVIPLAEARPQKKVKRATPAAKRDPSGKQVTSDSSILGRTPRHAPPELLRIPGMLGKVVDYAMATANRPQLIYAVATALALGSVLMGRRYMTTHQNYSSLYFIVLGSSGTGKEHCKTVPEELLHAANLGVLLGPSRYTSESGLMSALMHKPTHLHINDELGRQMGKATKNNDGFAMGVSTFQMECFGRLHGTLRPVGFAHMHMSAKDQEKSKNAYVCNPALTILSMSTQETFFDALESKSLRDGHINRFIVMECTTERVPSRRMEPIEEPPAEIIEWMQRTRLGPGWNESNAGNLATLPDAPNTDAVKPWIIKIDDAAHAAFDTFELRIIDAQNLLDPQGMAEMWGRAREIAMRLSMIVAQSCHPAPGSPGSNGDRFPTVTKYHADWAIAFVTFFTEEMVTSAGGRLAESVLDAAHKDAERCIYRAKQRGLTVRELRNASRKYRGLPFSMQRDVWTMLQQDGEHLVVKEKARNGKERQAMVHSHFTNDESEAAEPLGDTPIVSAGESVIPMLLDPNDDMETQPS